MIDQVCGIYSYKSQTFVSQRLKIVTNVIINNTTVRKEKKS